MMFPVLKSWYFWINDFNLDAVVVNVLLQRSFAGITGLHERLNLFPLLLLLLLLNCDREVTGVLFGKMFW